MRRIQKCHKMSHLLKNVRARFFESGPCPKCQVYSTLMVSVAEVGVAGDAGATTFRAKINSPCHLKVVLTLVFVSVAC
jgi:hypothetical protein